MNEMGESKGRSGEKERGGGFEVKSVSSLDQQRLWPDTHRQYWQSWLVSVLDSLPVCTQATPPPPFFSQKQTRFNVGQPLPTSRNF